MARTFVQPGNTVDAIAPLGGVTSGTPLLIGNLFGVPEVDAAAGETFSLTVVGVHRLAKASGALEPGALAYWDVDAANVTGTASGNYLIGVVLEHAGSDDATCVVRLDGVATSEAA